MENPRFANLRRQPHQLTMQRRAGIHPAPLPRNGRSPALRFPLARAVRMGMTPVRSAKPREPRLGLRPLPPIFRPFARTEDHQSVQPRRGRALERDRGAERPEHHAPRRRFVGRQERRKTPHPRQTLRFSIPCVLGHQPPLRRPRDCWPAAGATPLSRPRRTKPSLILFDAVRALIVTDRSFARRERDLLSRLEVGLADEGVRVARADPVMDPSPPPGPISERFTYPARTPLLGNAGRAARLMQEMVNRRFTDSEGNLDIVHAWGRGCWWVALAAARRAGAPLIVEYASTRWSASLRRLVRAAGGGDRPVPLLCLCPTEPLRAEVHAIDPHGRAEFAPWGVRAGVARPRAEIEGPTPRSFTIASSGRQPQDVHAAIEGLARALAPEEDALLFVDEAAVRRESSVWKHARSLGLLDRISVIADLEGRRSLILRTDVLVQPEASGEFRSITLDALAAGMLVLARDDGHNDALLDGVTARLVPRPSADAWRDAVRWTVDHREEADELAARAQQWVRDHRKASQHVRLVLEAYSRVAAVETQSLAVR